jgi:hypothetical protein
MVSCILTITKEFQMSANSFEIREQTTRDQEWAQGRVDNRQGLLGFIALISLAIPALLIRSLLPDLNPLILAGLGVAVYSAYLAVMIAALWRQDEQARSALQAAPVAADKE